MKIDAAEALTRLGGQVHGVLCTLHPRRGPDPQPVVYAIGEHGPDRYIGVAIDRVKPKSSTRLQREVNLAADPRASLLIEHWETEDWSRLWWVRAELAHVPTPPPELLEQLAGRLARAVPQYADRPFHRVLVCRIAAVTGWSATAD